MSVNLDVEKILQEAWKQRGEGNYEGSRKLVEEAQFISSEDDYNSLGRVFHIYAQFESDHGHYSQALTCYQQSLEFYKRAENSNRIAHSTRHIADTLRALGRVDESEDSYRTAIAIYRENSQTYAGDLANALAGYAEIVEQRSKTKDATTAWEEARGLYQACNIQSGVDMAIQKLKFLQSK